MENNLGNYTAPSNADTNNIIQNLQQQIQDTTQQVSKNIKDLPIDAENKELTQAIAKMKTQFPDAKKQIEKAAAMHKKATCIEGTKCYEQETLHDLEYKYTNALEVAKSAPQDVITTKKNLYTFKYSKHYWNKMERDKYKKIADTKYNEMVNSHSIKNKELDVIIDSYSNSLTNQTNMRDYISTLKTENKQLDHKIRNKLSTLNTNERKVWYEQNELGYMSKWKKLMFYIYYIFVLVFIYYFIKKKLWKAGGYRNRKVDIALLILFVFWGYINMHISGFIFKIIQFFIGLIPKDAYSKL